MLVDCGHGWMRIIITWHLCAQAFWWVFSSISQSLQWWATWIYFVKKRTVFKAHPFFSFIHFLILKNSNFFHLIQSNKTNAQANTQTIYIHLSYLIFYRLNNISSSNFESYVELWSILLFIQQNEKRIQVCFHSFI